MTNTGPPPGWYVDPGDAYLWRWWDGASWTAYTAIREWPTQPDLNELRASEERLASFASWAPVVYAGALIATALIDWSNAGQWAHFFHAFRVIFHQIRFASEHPGGAAPVITSFPTVPLWTYLFDIVVLAAEMISLIWQFRSAKVARNLGYPARYSPGWGVGCWFVPIVQLWMPHVAVRDLLPPAHPERRTIRLWWLTLLIGVVLATSLPFTLALVRGLGVALVVVSIVVDIALAILGRRVIVTVVANHRDFEGSI